MSINTSGDITGTVESTIQNMFGAASTYGANASGLASAGEGFINSLVPPDFNLQPTTTTAPVPTFTAPTFNEKRLSASPLSGLEAGLIQAKPIRAHHQIESPSKGKYEIEAESLPGFAWDAPIAPDPVATPVLLGASPVTTPTSVYVPDVTGVDVPYPETPPEWGGEVEFDFSGAPGAKPTLPTLKVPTVTVPAIPDEPTWSTPEEVVLSEIDLPTLVPIAIPDVSSIYVPSLVLPELQSRLDYTDAEFDDSVIQYMISEVREVLGGRLAIPSHIWTRIWERVAADVNRQYLARKREAQRAHAKLGWSMPGGVLLEAMQVAATEINAEISAKANEIAIKQAEMQQADYWQAMQQGVALTTLLSQIHNARQERLLKAAIAVIEAQTQVYNAVIAAFNAQVQAITADIEIKKLQLQAELTKVEVYKTEMEGAKLGVEVDKAKVEMYVAQWQAVKTQAEAFDSMVRAIGTQVEAQKAAVEAYGEQVKAQSLIVQMWSTEWDAYAKKIEAEKLKLNKYEAEARVFESQIGRFKALVDSKNQRAQIQIEDKKLGLQRAQIDVSRYQADWQGEQIKLSWYDAYIKGASFPLEAAKINAEIYQATVQGKLGEIQAWMAPYDAYTKLLQKDAVRAQLQNSYASLYSALMTKEQLEVEWKKVLVDLDKTYEQLVQEYNKASVAEHQAEAQYEAAQISAQASAWGASAEIYKADVQAQTAIAGVQGDIYKASVEVGKSNVDTLVEDAKIRTAQWQAAAQLATAQLQASASVYAQLGSAAYAATNASLSAGQSYSSSKSESVSTNYNYSGQITGE